MNNKRLNILWVSHLLPFPPVGGARIRSYNLLKEMVKYHNVFFVGLSQVAHQQNRQEVESAVWAINKFCQEVSVFPFSSFRGRISFLLLVVKSFFSKKSYKENWCKSKEMFNAVRVIICTQNIDLIHFDTISLLPHYSDIINSVPFVINHHNVESHMMSRRAANEVNIAKKIYFMWEAKKIKRLESHYCPASLNVMVSVLDEERIKKELPGINTQIVPNGVDVDYFVRRDEKYINNSLIWVGGLTWYPNVEAVVYLCEKVWPLIIEKVKNARLFIVGKDPSERIRSMAYDYEGIEVMGFVDDIRPLMSGVSACVCPLWDGGGTRLKVLNSMALGTPLVATKMACEGIPVQDEESVLFADNAEEFCTQILRIFNDEQLRNRLTDNSISIIREQFTYKSIGYIMSESYIDWVDTNNAKEN